MKKRVIINPVPQAQSGLEIKMGDLRAGLGFNANKLPWPVMAGKLSAPDIEVNSTLKPVPREDANLEAEKGEVAALPTKSGIPDTFKIGGKRHHSGGTPLNLPSDSFIFSDTAAMRIKDPTILAQFGMSVKGAGYTPAEIAKKYDVNQFKKVLADPDSEKLQKATAEMMIGNYNLKLAKLAILQESMKGFPQGIPAVAMPYIEEMGIDPAQFVQMNPGGAQTEQASTQQTQMDDVGAEAQGRFGGYMEMGGVPKFGGGGLTPEQAKVMYEAALRSNDPAKMKFVADRIEATKNTKDKWWSGAWNPFADEWDFDKYEDQLRNKATQVQDTQTRSKNFDDYWKTYYTKVYPYHRNLQERFQKNPLGNYTQQELSDIGKWSEVLGIGTNLANYKEAIQADKEHRAPKTPVSFDVMTSNFDPALLNPYLPVVAPVVAPAGLPGGPNKNVIQAEADAARKNLTSGKSAAPASTTTSTSKWDKYKVQ